MSFERTTPDELIALKSKRFDRIFVHNTETVDVPASGGRRTILRIDGKVGIVRQITLLTEDYDTRMIVRIDNEYDILFPTPTTLSNHWLTTDRILNENVFITLAKGSGISYVSTISIEFVKSVELIILNESSGSSFYDEAHIMADILRDEYLNESFISVEL